MDIKGLHVTTHPLVAHKLTLLRDKNTMSHDFRRLLREITFYLGYEATKGLNLESHPIITPMNVGYDGVKIADKVSIIPILRAGNGMVDGLLELVPRASVHHIGMYRNKNSLLPVQYYNKLPKGQVCDVAYICDPMIATSNTVAACINIVKQWGAKKIIVIATIGSESGVRSLLEKHPNVEVYIGAIDKELSPEGMIMPGLGDAGDRQFSTPFDEAPPVEDDNAIGGVVSKRARSGSIDER